MFVLWVKPVWDRGSVRSREVYITFSTWFVRGDRMYVCTPYILVHLTRLCIVRFVLLFYCGLTRYVVHGVNIWFSRIFGQPCSSRQPGTKRPGRNNGLLILCITIQCGFFPFSLRRLYVL